MAVGCKLTDDRLIGASCSVAGGISALDHKTVYDAVECESVIESFVDKLGKVFNRCGCSFFIERYCDRSVIPDLDLGMMHGGCIYSALLGFVCLSR